MRGSCLHQGFIFKVAGGGEEVDEGRQTRELKADSETMISLLEGWTGPRLLHCQHS